MFIRGNWAGVKDYFCGTKVLGGRCENASVPVRGRRDWVVAFQAVKA